MFDSVGGWTEFECEFAAELSLIEFLEWEEDNCPLVFTLVSLDNVLLLLLYSKSVRYVLLASPNLVDSSPKLLKLLELLILSFVLFDKVVLGLELSCIRTVELLDLTVSLELEPLS